MKKFHDPPKKLKKFHDPPQKAEKNFMAGENDLAPPDYSLCPLPKWV